MLFQLLDGVAFREMDLLSVGLTRYPTNSVASDFSAVLGNAMPKVIPPVPEVLGIFHVSKLIPVTGSL